MSQPLVIAINGSWLSDSAESRKKLEEKHLVRLSGAPTSGLAESRAAVKVRDSGGNIRVDLASRIVRIEGSFYVKSISCAPVLRELARTHEIVFCHVEGSPLFRRCVFFGAMLSDLHEIDASDPQLRLFAYDLPPREQTAIDESTGGAVFGALVGLLRSKDSELFASNASDFLEAPHVLVPLFEHVMRLSSASSLNFPVLVKVIADEFRRILETEVQSTARIHRISKNHQEAWFQVQGEHIAFLDAGVARISGVPGSEPLALRVGIYSVRPGISEPEQREGWQLTPYVIGDITQPLPGVREHHTESPDHRRLMEAARYCLEPLTGLEFAKRNGDLFSLFVHGPLVNQFLQYDEGKPWYLPCLRPDFLETFGITKEVVLETLRGVPGAADGTPLWNQFMAVYGLTLRRLYDAQVPVLGVVERTRGQWLSEALLYRFVQDGVMLPGNQREISRLIEDHDISDDFLFGCVLNEGEYVTPLPANKNAPRRARDQWQSVVAQYARPKATVLKTSAMTFPFRVELNGAAEKEDRVHGLMRLLYHTARLLPNYAFPVGLDIADRLAKIPDWLSRGVSTRVAASVLRRALDTGDPRLVAQVRQYLARNPRDFFYRPEA